MIAVPSARPRSTLTDRHFLEALAFSLMFHLALLVVSEGGRELGLWKNSILHPQLAQDKTKSPEQARPEEQSVDLQFVDVDPAQASPEPPKNAKFYSARNSVASSPEPKLDMPMPKIEGTQDKVLQALDRGETLKTILEPVQPPLPELRLEPLAPPEKVETKPAEPTPPPPKPAPTPPPGDVALATPPKPAPPPIVPPPRLASIAPARPVHRRPMTLAEARMRHGIRGERMKEEGGGARFDVQPSFDARATLFGAYDEKIVEAIRNRWYDLLDQYQFVENRSGKVVLEFALHDDGRITDMRVSETEVSFTMTSMCQRAVEEPSPYEQWPSDLRRLIGKSVRQVRFTFYYN